MSHTSRQWRLFCLALFAALVVIPAESQTPALTTISDTVYRADGNPASGVLLIAWPPFTTANGVPVAAGNKSVALGTNGSMTVQLTPNSGATPAGTLYTVVYQLTDATVKIEYWSVGTTSPQTIAAVRTAAGVATSGSQFATQQYVNAQLANVVHLGGTETITGPKQFTVPPVLPTSSQSGQAVNKAYVDASVANVGGGGTFVSRSGEIRWSDFGWGPYNDQNLAGRFTTQTFTLPRVSKVQDYYLRQFDASTPPKYSRFSAALHIDYPY